MGNERALSESESVWKYIVHDAKDRQCLFHADEGESLAKFIMEVKKEMDQFDEILDSDSFFFYGSEERDGSLSTAYEASS